MSKRLSLCLVLMSATWHILFCSGCRINDDDFTCEPECAPCECLAETSDALKIHNVKIEPNPFRGDAVYFSFEAEGETEVEFEVIDLTGRRVASETYCAIPGQNIVRGDWFAGISTGVYLLQIKSGGVIHRFKVIKEND